MDYKKCSKCKLEFSLDCFYKDKSKSSGLTSACSSCLGIKSKKYYLDNKEEQKIKRKEYYTRNKTKILEKALTYSRSHKDQRKITSRKYYTSLTKEQHEKRRIDSRNRIRDVKKQCVKYAGGECQICGFNSYPSALEFHHLDPAQKDFNISQLINSHRQLIEKIEKELDKCLLVCVNCHRGIHSGNIKI